MSGDRSAYLSVGTWSLVGIESGEPVVDDAAYRANLTNEGGVEGTFRVLRNVTGLWLLNECCRVWARVGSRLRGRRARRARDGRRRRFAR